MKWWVTGLIIAIGTAVAYALWRRYKLQQQAKQGIGYGGIAAAGLAAATTIGAAGVGLYRYATSPTGEETLASIIKKNI